MTLSRSLRRCAALAAAFAITLQALWPLLAQARPKDPSLQVPVCTVDGITHYLEIKAGKKTPLDERSAQHGEHCKLCVFGGENTVASQPDAAVFFLKGFSAPDFHAVLAPELSSIHSPVHPRAPPALR